MCNGLAYSQTERHKVAESNGNALKKPTTGEVKS